MDTDEDLDAEPEDDEEESNIECSNLIFLPFHPVFQLVVLFAVITKAILGPIQSIYPVVYCSEIMDKDIYLTLIKYFYWYCCDPIYFVDTMLHIMHRQMTDKAVRREYLPKSGFLLIVDIISLVPFFRLMITELCPPTKLWPNIMSFSEFVIIYRVADYFNLQLTHSPINLVFGFTIILICTVNCMTCFLILLTKHGLCKNCNNSIYDWRNYIIHKMNATDEGLSIYLYAAVFVFAHTINEVVDDIRPVTMLEFVLTTILASLGYIMLLFILYPKLFAESILFLRRINSYHPHVMRLIAQTKRRCPNKKAHIDVEKCYRLLWTRRTGITRLPEFLESLPRYLKIEIKHDMCWHLFHHSPILRKTSIAFQRQICNYIIPDYKLPGEKFFCGQHSMTNLYYIKSGVVEIISSDDGITPILSVTHGTVFGDISFILPSNKKVLVRCLTYCEVLFLTRINYLRVMHQYPDDRKMIIHEAKERIKHARTLFTCKQNIRGLDRTEDENVVWLKRRWWEITSALENLQKKSNKRDDSTQWEVSLDDCIYHCPKYIGLLVLCNEIHLKKQSLFVKVTFPWILVPNSQFSVVWDRIVLATVFLVLIFYPPMLAIGSKKSYFHLFQFWTNFIYMMDIIVSLMTAMSVKDHYSSNFASVMFQRCRTLNFVLDVMATIWIENILLVMGKPNYYKISQLNRLIKSYKLFTGNFRTWRPSLSPQRTIIFTLCVIQFCYVYISGFTIYMVADVVPNITKSYFFGEDFVNTTAKNPERHNLVTLGIAWCLEIMYSEYLPYSFTDLYIAIILSYGCFLTFAYSKAFVLGTLYLRYKQKCNFQELVSNLKRYYKLNKIHSELLKRFNRYILCHWKYDHGIDIIYPSKLKDEPYDIYWKVQGEIAEKIISESPPFLRANSGLIRELAYAAKFMISPKGATIFLFGVECKNLSWVVEGFIKCEYHDEQGKLVTEFKSRGSMLSPSSVFFGKSSLRTYTAYTDCETLTIPLHDFYNILKHYPNEWSYFDNTIKDLEGEFIKMYDDYMTKYDEYKRQLRRRIFHYRHVRATVLAKPVLQDHFMRKWLNKIPCFRRVRKPGYLIESHFIRIWMLFRLIVACISISAACLEGGSGAVIRPYLIAVGWVCNVIAWIDILIKLNIEYYDKHGIIISSRLHCAVHYLSRSFILDVIGAFPWHILLLTFFRESFSDDDGLVLQSLLKFAHLYLVFGYFNFLADGPTLHAAFIIIFKWQLVLTLVTLGLSHFLMSYCVSFQFDSYANLITVSYKESCWINRFYNFTSPLTNSELHLIYAHSMNLAQSGIMKLSFGNFHINQKTFGIGLIVIASGILQLYVMCCSVTLLILKFRGHRVFQQAVTQLYKFLKAERVEKDIIQASTAHFRYWWMRTKGINIYNVSYERFGAIFRQDLNYFFYHKTFNALATLLKCEKSIQRQLASVCTQLYVLPKSDIIREMDLTSNIYIIHRGIVSISQDGNEIVTLTRGCIFGQLLGTTPRPVRITAKALNYVDVLLISLKMFQDVVDDDVRKCIEENEQSKTDYMATTKSYSEGPTDTVEFIIKRRKAVRFPWMEKQPIKDDDEEILYYQWLYLAWFIEPVTSAFLVLLLVAMPYYIRSYIYTALTLLDLIHLANIFTEYYTVHVAVVGDKCVLSIIGSRIFKNWYFYVDVISIAVPQLTMSMDKWMYQQLRLLRLKLIHDFQKAFCSGLKNRIAPIFLKLVILFLMLHGIACGWIFISCSEPFSLKIDPVEYNDVILDTDEWLLPNQRYAGCATISTKRVSENRSAVVTFVVPRRQQDDYIVAMSQIIMSYVRCVSSSAEAITMPQIYYKVFLNILTNLINMWLASTAISFVYTRFRELYQHDYCVRKLITFLTQSGISPVLLISLKEYTEQLWRRQRGNWLPALAQHAPMCLREDLLCALYIHHLETPFIFRKLPHYFIRQLAARLNRIVVFPDKFVVQEGDICGCIYFIHEGEVEKWCKIKDGHNKMISLLSTNGYFGLIPGILTNVPFQYTYRTRTVVDFVVLQMRNWQDLLEGYPDIREEVLNAAKQLKKDLGR